MTRAFVFGLDAASPSLIERWMDDLPNLRRITREGAWGILESTIPPFTSPAWACMATGKNPAKVGIFGLRQRQDGTYQFKPPVSGHRHAPAVWDIASQAGKRSIVVNVPDTYPPTPIQGVMISGRPAPVDPGAAITYPADLRDRLDRLVEGYRVGPPAAFDDTSQSDEFPVWEEVAASQQAAVEKLMGEDVWDLIFYVSMAIDGIGHHFWKHLDSSHPDHDPQASHIYKDVMRQTYILEDRRIGQILEKLTDDDLLIIVSDHGSAPCYRHIAVNRWLIDHGYLALMEAAHKTNSLTGALAQAAFNLYGRSGLVRKLAKPFRPTGLRDAVVHSHFSRKTGGRVPFDALAIDWEHTTAYYLGDDRLYLNLAGREPLGIVQPGTDYNAKRKQLRDALLEARDPETGKRLFKNIYFREEIYSGPYLDRAPDLILAPADPHHNLGGAVGKALVDRPVVSGKHHPDGVIMAWGAGIRPGSRVRASIYDIAPTLLHVLGLPVPHDADGSAQQSWFQPDAEAAREPILTADYPEVAFGDYEWSPSEQKMVEERLRDLGYLD